MLTLIHVSKKRWVMIGAGEKNRIGMKKYAATGLSGCFRNSQKFEASAEMIDSLFE